MTAKSEGRKVKHTIYDPRAEWNANYDKQQKLITMNKPDMENKEKVIIEESQWKDSKYNTKEWENSVRIIRWEHDYEKQIYIIEYTNLKQHEQTRSREAG